MPVTIHELPDSRATTTDGEGVVTGRDYKYHLKGSTDPDEVLAKLQDEPGRDGDLYRQGLKVTPVKDTIDIRNPHRAIWIGESTFGVKKKSALGDTTVVFTSGGGQQHITQAIATVATRSILDDPPDYKGAIGVSGTTELTVEGVDVIAGQVSITVTKVFSLTGAPSPAKLVALRAAVNSSHFSVTDTETGLTIGLKPGEAQLVNTTWNRHAEGVQLVYEFAAEANETGIKIGDIPAVDKRGFDLLDVTYRDKTDDASKVTVSEPVTARVLQVYKMMSFAGLKL